MTIVGFMENDYFCENSGNGVKPNVPVLRLNLKRFLNMRIIHNMLAEGSRRYGRLVLLSIFVLAGIGSAVAQDDLYYDASKAKKEKVEKQAAQQAVAASSSDTKRLYYYDGSTYVPWDNVGDFRSADSYLPEGSGSDRNVDEYNRRGVTSATTDSITLAEFENYSAEMAATREMARFGGSTVAREALENEGYDLSFNNGYNEGYAAGYNNGLYNGDDVSVVVNFGTGYYPSWLYPYGYGGLYDTWGWPYNGWRYTYYNPYYYGWTPMWGWSWGWTSPSWAWGGPGWGWGGPGWVGPGWGGTYRPSSPSAAHRPRTNPNYNYNANRNGYSSGNHRYSGSSRPGYNPPVDGRVPGSASSSGNHGGSYNYGGSTSGRNSHYGSSSSGSSSGRSSGYSTGSSSGSSRGSYSGSSSSGRSSGGYSGGGRSGGSMGSSRSGGSGGHRSR